MGHLLDGHRQQLADEAHAHRTEIRSQRAAELADAARNYLADRGPGTRVLLEEALAGYDRAAAW